MSDDAPAADAGPADATGGAADAADAGRDAAQSSVDAGRHDAAAPRDLLPDALVEGDSGHRRDTTVEDDLALDGDTGSEADVAPTRDARAATDAAPAPDAHAQRDTTPPEADTGPVQRCPELPMACAEVEPAGTVEHHMEPLDSCAFALHRTGDVPAARALVARIAAQAAGVVPLEGVLDHLNRRGRPGVTDGAAERLRNHDHFGFRWNEGDHGVEYWYPQGITGGSDAAAGDRPAGRRLVLVSWYHRTDARPTKGARISLADLTDPDDVRYRHLLLVEPVERDGSATFGSAEYDGGDALHSGGIVWFGDLLYVADTARGFRVFDLGRIVEVTHTDDRDRIGVAPRGDRVDAHGYRYVVPQIARYQLTDDACSVRFSFVGLDRSSDPPTLLSGEYHSDDADGRVVSWPVDAATGWLAERRGEVRAIDAHAAAQTRMQGGLTWQGDLYLSSSSQTPSRYGRLYRTRPGLESRITAWPYGCEDLYYERDTDRIWTATEHPDQREVVSIPLVRP